MIADPLIAFLRRYFNIEILVCLGVNDMLITHKPYTVIIEAAKRFDKAIMKQEKVDKKELQDNVVIKYMSMPFIPAISQLPNGDQHELKNDTNRTDHFVFVNRVFDTVLNAKKPERHGIPHLHTLGISNDPIDNFYPSFSKHIFTHWEYDTYKKKNLNKHFRKTKDVIHLCHSSKILAWNKIHSYFCARKFMGES